MRSQGGVSHEDLMKLFELLRSHYLGIKPTLIKIRSFDEIHVDQV